MNRIYILRVCHSFVTNTDVFVRGEEIEADEEAKKQLVDEERLCEVIGLKKCTVKEVEE